MVDHGDQGMKREVVRRIINLVEGDFFTDAIQFTERLSNRRRQGRQTPQTPSSALIYSTLIFSKILRIPSPSAPPTVAISSISSCAFVRSPRIARRVYSKLPVPSMYFTA